MGRVFDALRRHSATEPSEAPKRQNESSERRSEAPSIAGLTSRQIEEELLSG